MHQIIPVDAESLKILLAAQRALQKAYVALDDAGGYCGDDLMQEISTAEQRLHELRFEPVFQ